MYVWIIEFWTKIKKKNIVKTNNSNVQNLQKTKISQIKSNIRFTT